MLLSCSFLNAMEDFEKARLTKDQFDQLMRDQWKEKRKYEKANHELCEALESKKTADKRRTYLSMIVLANSALRSCSGSWERYYLKHYNQERMNTEERRAARINFNIGARSLCSVAARTIEDYKAELLSRKGFFYRFVSMYKVTQSEGVRLTKDQFDQLLQDKCLTKEPYEEAKRRVDVAAKNSMAMNDEINHLIDIENSHRDLARCSRKWEEKWEYVKMPISSGMCSEWAKSVERYKIELFKRKD